MPTREGNNWLAIEGASPYAGPHLPSRPLSTETPPPSVTAEPGAGHSLSAQYPPGTPHPDRQGWREQQCWAGHQ